MNIAIIIVWSLFAVTDHIQVQPAKVNALIHYSEAIIENSEKLIIICTKTTSRYSKYYDVKTFEKRIRLPKKANQITRGGATIEVPSVVPKMPQTSKIQQLAQKPTVDAIYQKNL